MRSRRNSFQESDAGNGACVPRVRAVLSWLGLCVALLVSAPPLASAQSTITVDAYLHGSGGTANPPTLTADLLPSISLYDQDQRFGESGIQWMSSPARRGAIAAMTPRE